MHPDERAIWTKYDQECRNKRQILDGYHSQLFESQPGHWKLQY